MATVLVIDASASVRETLRIVLGHEHEVSVGSSLDETREGPAPDLVVLGLPPLPRDDRSLGESLARVAPDRPVLLLHAASEVDLHALLPPQVPVELLPKPFDAYGIRAHARALLAARAAAPSSPSDLTQSQRRFLEFPFLPRPAAAIMRRALTVDAPVVLLQGEPGTGAAAVAVALHAVRGGRGRLLELDGARLAGGELEREVVAASGGLTTIFVTDLDRTNVEVQRDLLRLVRDRIGVPSSSLRLVGTARGDLGELASTGRFLPELAYLVTTIPIVLAPLRERSDDIAALVAALTRASCARLRLPDVSYSAAALEKLRHYLWFGNIAELDAVLARTLTLHQPTVVEPEHLVFLAEDAPRAMAARVGASPRPGTTPTAPVSGDGLAGLDLEVVLGELAHELRNPMVTIKTFTQHLDSVLADPEVRARFTELTTDAIDRMDGVLENLLDFSRFRAPTRRPIAVDVLLDRALAEHADELARRHVTVERNGTGAGTVDADESQVLFALRSLCRGLVSDLVPHTPIKIRAAEPGVVELQVRTEASTAARLAVWVEPRSASVPGAESPPLAWALATALLERNGGTLKVDKGEPGITVIRVEWALQAASDTGH